MGKFNFDGDREEEGKKCHRGRSNRRSPVLTSGRASCSRAPLTSGLGFPRAGPGDDAGLRSRRCTAPREGRAPGRGEKVDLSLEGILLTIFFPFPGDAAAPQVPSLAVRGQSRRQRHNIPARDGTAGLGPLGVASGQRKESGKIREVKAPAQGASPGKSFRK